MFVTTNCALSCFENWNQNKKKKKFPKTLRKWSLLLNTTGGNQNIPTTKALGTKMALGGIYNQPWSTHQIGPLAAKVRSKVWYHNRRVQVPHVIKRVSYYKYKSLPSAGIRLPQVILSSPTHLCGATVWCNSWVKNRVTLLLAPPHCLINTPLTEAVTWFCCS